MKKEPRSDERFVTRCAIADNILRYSFRLDRPDLSKRPQKGRCTDRLGSKRSVCNV